jgi:hypothetical protein
VVTQLLQEPVLRLALRQEMHLIADDEVPDLMCNRETLMSANWRWAIMAAQENDLRSATACNERASTAIIGPLDAKPDSEFTAKANHIERW